MIEENDGIPGALPRYIVLKEWFPARDKSKRIGWELIVGAPASSDVNGVFLRESGSDKWIRYTNCRIERDDGKT